MVLQSLQEKYKALSAPIKASVWFTVCSMLQKAIAFLTVPVLTRLMPTDAYGRYAVFQSWYMVLSPIVNLNLGAYVLTNGMLKYEKDRSGYVSSLRGLSATATVIWFLIYLPFARLWENATSLPFWAMLFMSVELLMVPSYEYVCSRERYEYRYKWTVTMSILYAVAVPAFSIPAVYLSVNKDMAAIFGRTLVPALIYIAPTVLILTRSKKLYDKAYWKFALRFNLPLMPHFLSSIVLQQSDRIMISHIVGDDKAGIYSVAYSAAMVLQLVNSAVLASFIPYTYNGIKDGKLSGIRRLSIYLLAMIAGLNLALICVAPEIVRIMAPPEYSEAVYVIPPVAISGVFMFLFNIFANIEYYHEETKFVAVGSICAAVANILLNWLCIPRFGYIAAGYTTLACYILYSLGHYVFMRLVIRKHMDGRRVYNEKILALISFSAVLLSLALLALYDHPIIRYALVLTAGLACIVKRNWIIEHIKEIRRKKT